MTRDSSSRAVYVRLNESFIDGRRCREYTRLNANAIQGSPTAMSPVDNGSDQAPMSSTDERVGGSTVAESRETITNAAKMTSAPEVDVRVVLLTVVEGSLLIALEKGVNGWRLPRGLPSAGEPLDAAA